MLLQIKVYLIGVLYLCGAMFMHFYPTRNYEMTGSKIRSVRSIDSNLLTTKFVDSKMLLNVAERLTQKAEVAIMKKLSRRTAQNNSIIALELRNDKQSNKPGILVIGGLNPMSWGSPNAILELAAKLLYDSSYQTPFFSDYDWYLVPMANPDGMHFTKNLQHLPPVDVEQWSRNLTARTNTRPSAWHKNVDNNDGACLGTNVNRNFAYHWQDKFIELEAHALTAWVDDDVSKTPDRCSQQFPGLRPFATAEAQALRTYLHACGDVVRLAVHLQTSYVSKKEYIVYPWRYTLRQQSNYQTLQAIGEYAARQSRLPDGRLYEVHQGSNDERVAGTLTDYVSGVVGTELVYLIKPYHPAFPNMTDRSTRPALESYVKKSIAAILGLVRGWRSSTKQNTLSFFGREVEF